MPTIGVSVAVPEPWGNELQQYRIDVGDEAARHIPTHITLLPPHEVADADLDDVVAHLAKVAEGTEPFRVHLRGTGTFRPVSPVVFIGVVEGISQCEQLAAGVRRGPLAIERAFPYHPHVTVAQHLPEGRLERAFTELEGFDAAFAVEEMWMYLHDDISGWHPSKAFPLGR
ncbi:MAG: 2-5 ligase family protein [Marmoricola sp.]|nr:2-5 ligase family protein [Marmoricola sp.]